MNPLLVVKLVTLSVLLVGSIIACITPIILSQWKWLHTRFSFMKRVLQVMSVIEGFAGGILLGGGMLHLIPDASEKLSDAITAILEKKKKETDVWFVEFPWSALTACCGLLTIYFLENVLLKMVVYLKVKQEGHQHQHHQHADDPSNLTKATNYGSSYNSFSDQEDGNAHELYQKSQSRKLTLTLFFNALVIWISLSVHSVFEGLGLGSETDEKSMWSLFAAIMAHKFVAAFALGVIIEKGFRGVAKNRTFSKIVLTILFVLSFSLATPVGIAIGIGITEAGKSDANSGWQVAESCLLALAAGAFLHVSLFEVLGDHDHRGHTHTPEEEVEETIHETDHHHEKETHPALVVFKFSLFLIGFTTMAVLARWT